MKHLQLTPYEIKITSLCFHPSQRVGVIKSLRCEQLELSFGGPVGDHHEGELREACVRVKQLHPKGTQIRNERQVTMVSKEELELIAERLQLSTIDERWLGANILIEGLPDLSHLPPGSRLQGSSGATLVADLQNHPCSIVKNTITAATGGEGSNFKAAAEGLRGVLAQQFPQFSPRRVARHAFWQCRACLGSQRC